MLYGVKKIEFCAANLLAFNGKENVYYGVAPELLTPLTEIQCVPMARASLSIEQTVQNKEVLYTSKLQFVTDADPELAVGYYAFVVTTVAGERILIGAQLRPRVVVTTTQSVAGTAGELTAFTTSAEWTTDYKPLRLPVDNTPQADPRIFDICCGQITGGTVAVQKTVIWLNGDNTVLDTKTYYEGEPEPTTSAVPTKTSSDPYYEYEFSQWEVLSNVGNVKTYKPVFMYQPIEWPIPFTRTGTSRTKTAKKNVNGSTTITQEVDQISDVNIWYMSKQFIEEHPIIYFKFKDTEGCTFLSADWSEFNAAYPNYHKIYHPNDPTFQVGIYTDEWEGEL